MSRLLLIFLFGRLVGSMLIKEAIIKIARDLKSENGFHYQEKLILDNYPNDLTESDIKKAMMAVASVSDVLLDLK